MTRFDPPGPLSGELRPPPDKSISHRAALLGAMADDHSRVEGFLDSADTRATLAAIEALGADVKAEPADGSLKLLIQGVGLRGAEPAAIDVGNAGTLLRIAPGWLAGQDAGKRWTIDGDESIRTRPVDRIAEPLNAMGGAVEVRDGRLPPLAIEGAALRGIDYELPVASAQVKSCLLLAGLLAEGETTIREPVHSRDHTERLLAGMGAELRREHDSISVHPAKGIEGVDIEVPGDFSSAAFALTAALILPGSDIVINGVGLNGTRLGLLTILSRMGVEMAAAQEERAGGGIVVEEILDAGPEPFGALHVRASELSGTTVGPGEVPAAIDELPLVALLGCFAEGETVVSGAAELRHKESDRIAGVVDALRGLGAEIEARDDGFAVQGGGGLRGGMVDALGDHRLAMLGAVAGLASQEGVEVSGFAAAAVSYPDFEADLRALTS